MTAPGRWTPADRRRAAEIEDAYCRTVMAITYAGMTKRERRRFHRRYPLIAEGVKRITP